MWNQDVIIWDLNVEPGCDYLGPICGGCDPWDLSLENMTHL